MANPEMPSVQQRDLGTVPPQGHPDSIEHRGPLSAGPESTASDQDPSASAAAADAAAVEPAASMRAPRRPAGTADHPADPPQPRLPLLARVLLADLGVVIVALVALTIVEVQRLGGASLHLRRQAYAEDLAVLFLVAAVFGVVAYLLLRVGHTKVAIVQTLVTALVLTAAITSAVAGNPKPSQVTPIEQDQ